MIAELRMVVLTVDLPDSHLKTGDVGTVVHVYPSGEMLEVEFFTVEGQILDVVTILASQVRAVEHDDVLHARSFSGAG